MKILFTLLILIMLNGCNNKEKNNTNNLNNLTDNIYYYEAEAENEIVSETEAENEIVSETEAKITSKTEKNTESQENTQIINNEDNLTYEQLCESVRSSKENAHKWLKNYEGDWVIGDLIACFEIADFYACGETPYNGDDLKGKSVSIDLNNDELIIDNTEIYIISGGYEILKELLAQSMFNVHSQGIGKPVVDKIWYGLDSEKPKSSVKCINIARGSDYRILEYELFISADGDLLLCDAYGRGTFILNRK